MIYIRNANKKDIFERLKWPRIPSESMYSEFSRFGSIDILWKEISQKGKRCFCIERREKNNRNLIGYIVLKNTGKIASFGIMLHPDYIHTGIGGMVILKIIHYCFDIIHTEKVETYISIKNIKVISIANKLAGAPISQSNDKFLFQLKVKDFRDSKWQDLAFLKNIIWEF